MAERLTVDQEVVGSTPISLPQFLFYAFISCKFNILADLKSGALTSLPVICFLQIIVAICGFQTNYPRTAFALLCETNVRRSP